MVFSLSAKYVVGSLEGKGRRLFIFDRYRLFADDAAAHLSSESA